MPTLDELREEYERARAYVPDEYANPLPQATEALIAALEQALEDSERMLFQANSLIGTTWSYMLRVGAVSDEQGGEALVGAMEKWNRMFADRAAHDALHADGE